MRIVGYGLCGPGEAKRHMEATIKNLKSLCDEVVICLNNAGPEEEALLKKHDVHFVKDNREWGKEQWRIKEEFVTMVADQYEPDWFVAMDMDETFDQELTRETLEELLVGGHASYHTFVVNHWDKGYNPDRCFWKVQIWENRPEFRYEFQHKALHPGLVPIWAGTNAAYAPYYLNHWGLQKKTERNRRVKRYAEYDPEAKYIGKEYYDSLENKGNVVPFNPDVVHKMVEDDVKDINQPVKEIRNMAEEKYYYVKNKHGMIVDIPEKHLESTLKRPGFELVTKDPIGQAPRVVDPEVVEEPTTACDECGFVAKSAFGLKSHMRKHAQTTD